MREWLVRLVDWFRRGRLERELSEELRFHRERLTEAALARGADAAEAARFARRRLGDDARTREATRARWSLPWLDIALQDARHAIRGLRRAPAFTALVVVTLALGIGANAAMFGVIDRLMFRPLSHLRDPDSVSRVYLQWDDERGNRGTWTSMSYRRYVDLTGSVRSFSEAAAFSERQLAVGEGESARDRRVGAVSASFFRFFDVTPHAGRFFTADEDVPPRGAEVAVLSWAFWQREFGGEDAIGRTIAVGNVVMTIIGVAPPGFRGVGDADPPVLFIPIASQAAAYGHADPASYYTSYDLLATDMLVRRRAGVDEDAASLELTQAFRRSWEVEQATRRNPRDVESARPEAIAASVRPAAGPDPARSARTGIRVSAVAAIVLLIACANVANLMLGRALRLRRETSVRMALGAGRVRLLVPMLVEAAVLAGLAAALGLLAAR